MRDRFVAVAQGLVLSFVCAFGLQAAETPIVISVNTDHPDSIYSAGQQVRFTVTARRGDQPLRNAEVTIMIAPALPSGKKMPKNLDQNGSATVDGGTLDSPGVLSCIVHLHGKETNGNDKVIAAGQIGAGFDLEKTTPSMPPPDDFDAFWTQQKARLAAVPMNPVLTPVESRERKIEAYDVKLDCVPPRPATAYFARPRGATPKSLPIILLVHAAGVEASSLAAATGAASKYNALAMDINAHGIPNGKTGSFYSDLAKGELDHYQHLGREDRETCYFLGMLLRDLRGLDFLTSQPEWNGRTLIVRGGSQGGGQAIALAGLDPRVTLISACIPALCDHTGCVIGRKCGWPGLVPCVNGKPDPKILQVARYFDCVNFAPKVKAEALFCVGFCDGTCPPTSVYAAYNNIRGKKKIYNEPTKLHQVMPGFVAITDDAVAAHIAAMKGQ